MAAMFLPLSYRFSHASSASFKSGLPRATTANIASVSRSDEWFEETKGRISKVFDHKNELISISTYDTAWVAMVPSPFSSHEPCFPDALFWLLENQCHDGSWARPHHHSRLKKDVLSSTLACILALKIWGVGQQHINRGLAFLELNFASTRDESQISSIGFDIIFPAMLDHAKGLSLNLNLEKTTLNHMMNIRDLELKRCYESQSRGTESYLAYMGEGMGELQDWESIVMKYQRKNGSLFNSPSTTAAAFMALGNSNCLNYLNSLVNKFGGAVPAVYPLDIYSQLCTIDHLEKLGINRHFIMEIQGVLDKTYRCNYKSYRGVRGFSFSSENKRDLNTTLELYKASQLTLYPHEKELEKQTPKLRLLLEQQLSSSQSPQLNAEVKQALICPFNANLNRIAKRKAIEHYYNFDNTRMFKTSYSLANLGNKDFHLLSLEDYNQCQAIHGEEFREFGRWFVESRLNEVEIEVHRFEYCYLTAAATLFSPDDSDARMSWAKNAFLVTLIDDFFDFSANSVEDMKKLIHLVELSDEDISTEGCSRDVEIFFSALKAIICEDAEKGSKLQGRSIRSHLINIWLDMLHAFMKEVEWRVNKYVPTLEEYMSNAYVSFGMGPIVLQPLYLVGPIVSEEMVRHPDYQHLFKSLSTYGRLINDIRGYEREMEQGKVCAVPLYMAKNGGKVSIEDVIWEITSLIERERKDLMKLVLEKKSSIPRACRDLFWNMWSVLHLFYNKDDGYRSHQLIQVLDHIIHQPMYIYPSSSPPTLTTKQIVT